MAPAQHGGMEGGKEEAVVRGMGSEPHTAHQLPPASGQFLRAGEAEECHQHHPWAPNPVSQYPF